MDLEENLPRKKAEIVVGEKLDNLSLAELAERIAALEAEIGRTREVLTQKRSGLAEAGALFIL